MDTLLSTLGLKPNESSVYLAFLKHNEKTAAEISRILHMDKSSCYRAVHELVRIGLLVANPKKRGTTHSAVSPHVLKELLNKKKNELANQEHALTQLINRLGHEAAEKRATYIRVEKGIQAVRDSMDASLEAAIRTNGMIKERYRLDYPFFQDKDHIKWVNSFAERRIKAAISTKVIVDFAGEKIFPKLMKTDKSILKELRLMPKEMHDMHSLRIAGDLTIITSFDRKKDYIVITIKDKFVSELMESLFDFVWERSEKYI